MLQKDRIKILVVAPYNGMVNLVRAYALSRQDVRIDVKLGNREEGAGIAKIYEDDYDVFLSRAQTAELITRAVAKKVIDIGIGYDDLLRCIMMAKKTKTKFCLAGHSSLMKPARMLLELLEMDMPAINTEDSQEAARAVERMREEGYETVICDMIPLNYVRDAGMVPILVMNGTDSIRVAVDQAIAYFRDNIDSRKNISLQTQIIAQSGMDYLVLDEKGEEVFTCFRDQTELPGIRRRLRKELTDSLQTKSRSFFIKWKKELYSIRSVLIDEEDSPRVIFCVEKNRIPQIYMKYGIMILNRKDAEKSFRNSFISNTQLARNASGELRNRRDVFSGVMITGEYGSEKDKFAHMIYARGPGTERPLYIINCSLINDKSWRFLLGNYNSPFVDNGNTIYIANLNALSKERSRQLLSVILETRMHQRNHMIFSCVREAGGELPHEALEYTNALGAAVKPIPPLREQKEDIISGANLYIGTLNGKMGKEIVGLTDDAAQRLIDYDWPYNSVQFERVLREAVQMCDEPYISCDLIETAIEKEKVFTSCGRGSILPVRGLIQTEIDITRTLDEINREIVRLVLDMCGGNHTKAADRLGISRTTLWRLEKQRT